MSKNIVLLADGTWNDGAESNTNIHWLNTHLLTNDSQVVFYDTGVGTDWYNNKSGGALGLGLSRNIRQLYSHLIDVYEPGDAVYCFGFSRGAFTVRSLCGFINLVGNIGSTDEDDIESAYHYYKIHEPGELDNWYEQWKKPKSNGEIPIRFIGVFDTVGALGVPFEIEDEIWQAKAGSRAERIKNKLLGWVDKLGDRLRRPITGFHDTALGDNIEEAYHAVAIDEERALFPPQKVKQRWFAGVHSDVGGGYPVQDSEKLAHIPLHWIVSKALDAGLYFKPESVAELTSRVNKLALAPQHDSMTKGWKIVHDGLDRKKILRPIGNEDRASQPTGTVADHVVNTDEEVDESVRKRMNQTVKLISESEPKGKDISYVPLNLRNE